jgi:hypothetical protein
MTPWRLRPVRSSHKTATSLLAAAGPLERDGRSEASGALMRRGSPDPDDATVRPAARVLSASPMMPSVAPRRVAGLAVPATNLDPALVSRGNLILIDARLG